MLFLFLVLMDEIVEPAGFDASQSGILVAIWVSCAIIGGFAGGPIIDRTRAYKKMMVCFSCSSFRSLFLMIPLCFVFLL
jgi:cyanate permease